VDVLPVVREDLDIEINPEELKVDTYRSGGAGGQHVNKTDSAVRITHLPSGIVVQCQSERSQISNRNTAMKLLKSKLLDLEMKKKEAELAAMRGDQMEIAWGSQIRSYVFHPYSLVKDHRTGVEIGNVNAVMDGDIDSFIASFLRESAKTAQR
jgi:peptide chain release factor 2